MFFDLKLFLDPAILFILSLFITALTYFILKTYKTHVALCSIITTLKTFKKDDIIYRFKELDIKLSKYDFIANYWQEFKQTLVFNEKVDFKTSKINQTSANTANIQCTVDSSYFFNEENLIHNKMNYKFISAIPTILTGLGPLFTFLNIAIAFSKVDFSSQETTISSVTSLMTSMKAAAMVSVLAVGTSICFIVIERILYNLLCKKPLVELELQINKLFDSISSERFLVELLQETKEQNTTLNEQFVNLPNQIQTAIDKSFTEKLTPYLENLIFGVNNLQKIITDIANKKPSDNVIDEFFKKD